MSQPTSDVGNTKNQRLRSWFFTYNNPDLTWSQLSQLLSNGRDVVKLVGQKEVGSTGTEHFQGVVQYRHQVAFKTLKALDSSIHWEGCHNLKAALAYVTKTDTRVDGPWSMGWDIPEPIRTYSISEARPWQRTYDEIILGPVDPRKIYWLWEPNGGVGKTAFARFCAVHRRGLVLGGRGADIKYGVATWLQKHHRLDLAVFHFTRTVENYVSYEAIEAVKDGIFFNGKYESGMVVFNPPHIICLANFYPEDHKLSADRWVIEKLE